MKRGPKNSRNDLSPEFLREILSYDPLTGDLRWKVSRPPRGRIGAIAGIIDDQGRRKLGIAGEEYFAHRIIWVWMTGAWPEYEVDHRDEIKSNNKWTNLRHVTPSQNHRNRGAQKNNVSGYKGVCFDSSKQKWLATINVRMDGRKKHIHLGWYNSPEEAHTSYCAGALKFHGKEWAHF